MENTGDGKHRERRSKWHSIHTAKLLKSFWLGCILVLLPRAPSTRHSSLLRTVPTRIPRCRLSFHVPQLHFTARDNIRIPTSCLHVAALPILRFLPAWTPRRTACLAGGCVGRQRQTGFHDRHAHSSVPSQSKANSSGRMRRLCDAQRSERPCGSCDGIGLRMSYASSASE